MTGAKIVGCLDCEWTALAAPSSLVVSRGDCESHEVVHPLGSDSERSAR